MTISRLLRRLVLVGMLLAAVASGTGATAGRGAGSVRQPLLRSSDSVSTNWAGYVAAGRSFSHVTGSWIQPGVVCAGLHALDASSFWIGLGGARDSSPGLEQAGTAADCVGHRPRYYAWFEVLPAPATNIGFPVAPGDAIVADVDLANGLATFTLHNLTNGATFSRALPVRAPAVDSAEWIAEAPSVCRDSRSCRTLPLAHFGAVLFTGASATDDTHTGRIGDASWSTEAVSLASKSNPLSAVPSVLSEDGSSFSVATHGPRIRTALPELRPLFAPT